MFTEFFSIRISNNISFKIVFNFWGLMKTPMLSSVGFVYLRVGYREVFWEEFSRLT